MKSIKVLAEEYAHCYAFVNDETMPRKQAELYAAIDELEKQHQVEVSKEVAKLLEMIKSDLLASKIRDTDLMINYYFDWISELYEGE